MGHMKGRGTSHMQRAAAFCQRGAENHTGVSTFRQSGDRKAAACEHGRGESRIENMGPQWAEEKGIPTLQWQCGAQVPARSRRAEWEGADRHGDIRAETPGWSWAVRPLQGWTE